MSRFGPCVGIVLVCFAPLATTLVAQERPIKPVLPPRPGTDLDGKGRDLSKLSIPQRSFYLAAQSGADWLVRANQPGGRFVYGFLPSLKLPMEGDNYMHQAGAAFALARSARFFGGDKMPAAVARQALLTLLLETTTDAKDKDQRHSAAPPHLLPRGAATAWLVLAIHELPDVGADLLAQADQMTNYLRTLAAKDGGLALDDGMDRPGPEATDPAVEQHSGPMLYAIIQSQALRPVAWKLETLRKARPVYQAYWQKHKNPTMAPWHSAAFARAYELSKERAFADFVFEMNDWLLTLQYQHADPRRLHWVGGFQPWRDGKAVADMPDARSAVAAFSLAEACRVARQAGDAPRLKRYRDALEQALVFLAGIQYTEGRAQHFSDWYRPAIVGGFYASPLDGNLRIDYTNDCLTAMVGYLRDVVEW